MDDKYRATIHGNEIDWHGAVPDGLENGGTVTVDMTIVSKARKWKKPDGKKMVEALEKIAALGGVKSIPDPVAWQREIRRDRPLPGRD
jgi:hypothetical protein